MNIEFNEIPDWVCQCNAKPVASRLVRVEVGNSVRLGKGVNKLDWVSTLKRVK